MKNTGSEAKMPQDLPVRVHPEAMQRFARVNCAADLQKVNGKMLNLRKTLNFT